MKTVIVMVFGLILIPCSLFAEEISILFIGNSLTFFNDQPVLLENLAEEAQKDVLVGQSTVGGASLKFHCTYQPTIDKIYSMNWDYVILQGSSYHIAFPENHYLIQPYIEFLDSLIHDNCPSTKTVFFMDWAMKNGVFWEGEMYSYYVFQDMIYEGTLLMADRLNMIIAPVGWAWKTVVINYNGIDLFDSDLAHPSYSGSYLGACVYFSTIFREDVYPNSYHGILSNQYATALQTSASEIVMDNLELWNVELLNIGQKKSNRPGFKLLMNYPNPFNPLTNIPYHIEKSAYVYLSLYNSIGQNIRTLVSQIQLPGYYQVEWNGKNSEGAEQPSGIYFYQLTCDNLTDIKKMILIR